MRLKQINTINQAELGQVVDGIRIGSEFIAAAKEEIIQSLIQDFNQIINNPTQKVKINQAINSVLSAIQNGDFKLAYKLMAQVEGAIFNITDTINTSLLTMLDANSQNQTLYYYPDEADAIINKDQYGHKAGISSGITEAKNEIYVLNVQSQVAKHWANMLNTVNTKKAPGHIQTYRKEIYGKRREAQATGQILDAYMNHLAMKHPQILNSITSQKLLSINLQHTVLQEIGAKNFLELLKQSTNRTKWTSGGDVIIANRSGDIVVNIQIKSSLSKREIVGHLSTKTLIKHLNIIKNSINENTGIQAEQYAKTVYSLYATSAVVQQGIKPMIKKDIKTIMKPLTKF